MKTNGNTTTTKGTISIAMICIGLLPYCLGASSPTPEQIRRGQEMEKSIQEASQFIAGADVPALKKRFAELLATLPKTKWESVDGAVPNEISALRASWFISSTMYPIDGGLAESDPDAYVNYLFAKKIFAVLLDKSPVTAVGILDSFSGESPTALQAMLCGVVLQAGQTPKKATALNQCLRDAPGQDAWKRLLKSENPIIRSLALQMVPPDLASAPIFTESIRSALTNQWVSLQAIAIESAGKHRPPNVGTVLDDYLPRLQSSDVPAAVKESLREKTMESKRAITKSHSDGK